MRRWLNFDVAGSRCVATLDGGDNAHGLLIVSGGNEIRSGAHRGMATLAAAVAAAGHPVLRFDRRGIGDSEGENGGFEGSGDDIAAAIALFRREVPSMQRVIAFGNCDAATALALHSRADGPDALLLANPWVIESTPNTEEQNSLPPPAAIRARYLAKLRDPSEWLRLLRGGVSISKLARGLNAVRTAPNGDLAQRLAGRLAATPQTTVALLIAERDSTAQAFMAAWRSPQYASVRNRDAITLHTCATASHSFADQEAREWLTVRVLAALSS
jgi:exosortase A-associated hydrolase 1